MNQLIKIDEADSALISELYSEVSSIVIKKKINDAYFDEYYPLKRQISKIYKEGRKPTVTEKTNFIQLRDKSEKANIDYFNSISDWNSRMRLILEKYSYTTLKTFMMKYPTKFHGVNPSLMFAVNTKAIALNLGIPIIESLYSGLPKLINNYPEEWLKLVISDIDRLSYKDKKIYDYSIFSNSSLQK